MSARRPLSRSLVGLHTEESANASAYCTRNDRGSQFCCSVPNCSERIRYAIGGLVTKCLMPKP